MSFFGEVLCKHCKITTRFLSESTEPTTSEDVLYLIGDEYPIQHQESWEKTTSQCDYCGKDNDIYVLIKENHVVDFLNVTQMNDYLNGQYVINLKKKEEMIQKEINQTSDVFDVYLTLDYSLHPVLEGETFTLQGNVWNVKEVWKREFVEKDEEIRVNTDIKEGYHYLLERNGAHKWLMVTHGEKRNARFTVESPKREESEKWYQVFNDLQKTEEIYRMKMSEELTLFAYQQISGIHGQVYYMDQQLVYDVLEDSLDKVFEQVDEYLNTFVL